MRRRLRTFILIGVCTTVVDFVLLAVLREPLGLVPADMVSVTAAAAFSYLVNRIRTFGNDATTRWVRHPMAFVATAAVAGTIDVVLVLFLGWAGATWWAAKVVAVMVAASARWVAYRWVLFTEVREVLADRVDQPAAPGSLRLTVVVPAYNEAPHIATTIDTLRTTLVDALGPEVEILVVDDGSTDATSVEAQRAGARVITQPGNAGKGAAVRAGVLAARGRSVVFTDADLAYPPETIITIVDQLELGWDIAVGSRRHPDTDTVVATGRLRDLGGRAVNALTHLVLLGHFRDTQCGIKGFRSDVGASIFRRCRIDRFGFDVEVFCIAELDRRSLIEVPVSVRNRDGSSVRLVRDTAALLYDLVRIRRWAGEGVYRRPTPTGRG